MVCIWVGQLRETRVGLRLDIIVTMVYIDLDHQNS